VGRKVISCVPLSKLTITSRPIERFQLHLTSSKQVEVLHLQQIRCDIQPSHRVLATVQLERKLCFGNESLGYGAYSQKNN